MYFFVGHSVSAVSCMSPNFKIPKPFEDAGLWLTGTCAASGHLLYLHGTKLQGYISGEISRSSHQEIQSGGERYNRK